MYGMQIKDDSRKLADVQREWADKEEELRRRHASEIARVREQSEIERDQWQKAMNEKLEQQRADALAALTDKMEKQRDEEIDLVIVRLEEEAEVMNKYLALFKQHTTADERLRVHNERILELQEENARLQQALQRAEYTTQKVEASNEARVDSVRSEFGRRAQELKESKALLEEQLRRAAIENKELVLKHEHEIRDLKGRNMEELDGINARVRATVARKDEALVALQQQLRETEGRVQQYEQLLERQRAELLS